jgi:hypothetical protein
MAKQDRGRTKPGQVARKDTTNTSKKDSRLKDRSGPSKNKKIVRVIRHLDYSGCLFIIGGW